MSAILIRGISGSSLTKLCMSVLLQYSHVFLIRILHNARMAAERKCDVKGIIIQGLSKRFER